MTSDFDLSSVPDRPTSNQQRRRKSIARLFGTLSVPTNEALRANCLRDGCVIPLDLDHVRPDCLLPADVAALYTEAADSQQPNSPASVAVIAKVTVYVRLNFVRIAAYENQSVEIEIGIFDQLSERFVSENIVLSSKSSSLSDWVGFVDISVTPSCMIVARIYSIGGLVRNCSTIRDCRRQIGFSSIPLMRVFSEAPLTQYDLPVFRPKTDRTFAKMLTSSSAANHCKNSMAFKLRLQMANIIPLGTSYHSLAFQPTHLHPEPPSLIRFDIISGEFGNAFKTSQMNICIEASVIVRKSTQELACIRRGSQTACSSFSSGIVYHCNSPEFNETFTIGIDTIRREAPKAHVSLLLRALHVTRSGTVKTIGYATLMIFDSDSGRITTTNGQTIGVQLLDIEGSRKTRNRISFRSTIISKHDTDDDILALIISGKARDKELKLAHARIQTASNLDPLLQKKLMEHYITKGSVKKDTTLNASWSLYCVLRKRHLNCSGVLNEPISADILIANLLLCFRFNQPETVQLSLEVFEDPTSIAITDLANELAQHLVDHATCGSGFLSGRTMVLLVRLLANLMTPNQLCLAFDRLALKVEYIKDMHFVMSCLGGMSDQDIESSSDGYIAPAIRSASMSDEICYHLAKPLSRLLIPSGIPKLDNHTLLNLMLRLFNISSRSQVEFALVDVHILIIQAVRALHANRVAIPYDQASLYLSYVSRIAQTSSFDSAHIVLRAMELHAATLILDIIPIADDLDRSAAKTLLILLNGKDMESHRLRKRRSVYVVEHLHQWLRPWLLQILQRYSAVPVDQPTFGLLFRFVIHENVDSVKTKKLLGEWKMLCKEGVYERALCDELHLMINERWLYPNAIEFFKQVEDWESQNFLSCFNHLSDADFAISEGNTDRIADAFVLALNAIRHIDDALPIRLYIIDQLIRLYETMQVVIPELAQCFLDRGESQSSTDSGRLSDLQRALQISTECFEWEKAAMICERIIYGYTCPDNDPSFVPYFRRKRADLLRRIQTEDRVMPQYARVAFSASKSHAVSERGREFIYRLKIGESVLEFTDWFRMQYPYAEIKNTYLDPLQEKGDTVIAIQRVDVLRSSHHEEDNDNDSELDTLSLPVRFRHFSIHSDANTFSFARMESGPSKAGETTRSESDVSDQWYEIHRVAVANKFPFLSRRQLVVSHTKYLQSPIETAISAVRQVNQKLQREMEKIIFAAKQKNGNIDVGQLSLVLSGIIDAPVNGGIQVYRSSFLSKSERYTNEQQELENALRHQCKVLKKALNLFRDSVSPELWPLYTHLQNQLKKTYPNS